jgi:putative methyltransferase (TIGR04325 family)
MSLSLRSIALALLPAVVVKAIRYIRRETSLGPHVALLTKAGSIRCVSSPTPVLGTPQEEPLPPPEWEVVPNSDSVWLARAGWAHASIVATQLKKWQNFLKSVEGTRPLGQSHEGEADAPVDHSTHNTILSFGYALARAAHDRRGLSILDWGGGLGHYYAYARALMPTLALDYVVKDLPDLCAAGRCLLPEVTFLSDEDVALGRSYDFVFASSSVHYTRDHYQLIDRLCSSARGWLMITRTPFIEHADDFVVVQRPHMYGYMTEYPGWFMNRPKMLDFVAARGFELVRQFLVAERPNVPNAPEQAQYYGFLFRRIAPVQHARAQNWS